MSLRFGSKDFKKPISIIGNVKISGIIKCLRSIKKIIKKLKNRTIRKSVVKEMP